MKITKEIRRTILTKAMVGYKAAEKQKLREDLMAFANKTYEHEFGVEEKIVLASGLSERWYFMSDEVHIDCEGFRYRNSSYEDYDDVFCSTYDTFDYNVKMGRDRIFPGNMSKDKTVQIKPDHPLYKEARTLVKRRNAIMDAETELRKSVMNLLASVNTDKQLKEAWPEAMDFLPYGLATSTALVPVGLSDKINKALGIPSKASVATTAVREAAIK